MSHPVLYCYRHLWRFIDLIYPPQCAGCNKAGVRWCGECSKKTRKPQEPLCQICGIPITRPGICSDCFEQKRSNFIARSWGVYEEPLRTAIHRLKYNSDIGLAEVFTDYMVSDLKQLDWDFDVIVPVPLAKERKKERGYNQAAILARLIALNLNKRFNSVGLKRIRHTISQTRLSAAERRINVENAFIGSSEIFRDQGVLLIDDLATTCATLVACTDTLYKAGAKTVYSFTLARTL